MAKLAVAPNLPIRDRVIWTTRRSDIQCNVNIITDLEPSETVTVEEASSNASDTSQQLTEAQDRFATQSVKKENGGKVSWDLK